MSLSVVSSTDRRSAFFEFFEDVVREDYTEFFTIMTKSLAVATAVGSLSVSTKGAFDIGCRRRREGWGSLMEGEGYPHRFTAQRSDSQQLLALTVRHRVHCHSITPRFGWKGI